VIDIVESTERRKGLHDLAEQIRCLRDEFARAKEDIETKLNAFELWQLEAKPIVESVRRAMWTIGGAAVIVTFMASLIVWIWIQDHALLREISRLVIANTERLNHIKEDHDRMRNLVEELRRR
jgi:hypothetical protein